jgi:hypothetical protein
MPLYSSISVDTQAGVSGNPDVVVSMPIVRIGAGGIVEWDNRSKRTVDLVFADSTTPQAVPTSEATIGTGLLGPRCRVIRCLLPSAVGNVVLAPATNNRFSNGVGVDFRKFITPGTYSYHSATFPTVTGTIIVQ